MFDKIGTYGSRSMGPRSFRRWIAVVAALLVGVACQPQAGWAQSKRLLELTILSDSRVSITTQHEWLEALAEVGADRVSSKTANRPQPKIEEVEFRGSKILEIHAVINGRKIKLPGKSFSIGNKKGIRDFLDQLRQDGAETTLAEKKAFGLTSKQLVDIHGQLSGKVASSTKDQPVQSVVRSLVKSTAIAFEYSPAARRALADSGVAFNELKGLTTGTALAIVLRSHELAFAPQFRRGQGVVVKIVAEREVKEFWPTGWPVEAAPVNAYPKLFESIPLQVNRTPLKNVLDAVERRLELPFISDPAVVGPGKVNFKETLVTYNKNRSSYSLALRKMLNQAKPRLRHEIRQDEAGKKFLWIGKQ